MPKTGQRRQSLAPELYRCLTMTREIIKAFLQGCVLGVVGLGGLFLLTLALAKVATTVVEAFLY